MAVKRVQSDITVVEAAKRGQWIPEGAMWVEPDTNMTSGESLIRQVVHGKRSLIGRMPGAGFGEEGFLGLKGAAIAESS